MSVMPVAQDQPLHRDPRNAGPGRDAGRDLALLARRPQAPPLHGLLDVREFHGPARNRRREDPPGRAVRQGLLHRLWGHDRRRRSDQHREGRAWRKGDRVRPRRHWTQRDPGPAARGRRHDHRGRHQSGKAGLGRAFRDDALRQPEGGRRRTCALSREPDQERATRSAAPTIRSTAPATSQ